MTKTIKFNLICDGKPVRTIEDLQNNFVIEDVLAYYDNKLLHRWLEVREYNSQWEKISAIESDDAIKIIKELIHIFDMDIDEKKIEESIYILKYKKQRKESFTSYERKGYKVRSIIDDYEAGYRKLIDEILNNLHDIAIIKANIHIIAEDYEWIFKLNHKNLFSILRSKAPISYLAIMCILMNEKLRKYFLPVEVSGEDGTISLDTDQNVDKREMYRSITEMLTHFMFDVYLERDLVTFSGKTEGYWKELEPKGKKYMIISMCEGDYVRAAGNSGSELSSTDVRNKFVILDGIDYRSDSSTNILRYMEV